MICHSQLDINIINPIIEHKILVKYLDYTLLQEEVLIVLMSHEYYSNGSGVIII